MAVIAAIGVLAGCGSAPSEFSASVAPPGATVELSGLHPTYSGLPDLRNAATLVIVGRIDGSRPSAPPRQEPDPDGVEAMALPMTEYSVAVERVVQGPALAPGTNVAVRVIGGQTDGTVYVVEGAPQVGVGSTYLLFLRQAADGSWFPLAGDGAIASRTPAGDYVLPPGVAGDVPLQIRESELSGGQPPQAVVPSPPVTAPQAVTTPTAPAIRRVRLKVRARHVRRNGSVMVKIWGTAGSSERRRRVLVERRSGSRWRPLCQLTVKATGAFVGHCRAQSFIRQRRSSVVLRASLREIPTARRAEARVTVKLPARGRS